jgi:hypothetical protein
MAPNTLDVVEFESRLHRAAGLPNSLLAQQALLVEAVAHFLCLTGDGGMRYHLTELDVECAGSSFGRRQTGGGGCEDEQRWQSAAGVDARVRLV